MQDREEQTEKRPLADFFSRVRGAVRRAGSDARSRDQAVREPSEVTGQTMVIMWVRCAISLALLIVGFAAYETGTARLLYCIASFVISGCDRVYIGWLEALEGQYLNRHLCAVFCGILLFVIGRPGDASLLMIIMLMSDTVIARMEQSLRKNMLSSLMIRTPSMRLLLGGLEHHVPADRIQQGDLLRMSAGNVASIDCVVQEGSAEINLQYVTGSPDVTPVSPGSLIPDGAWVTKGEITVRASCTAGDSFQERRRRFLESYSSEPLQESRQMRMGLSYVTPVFLLLAIGIGLIVPWIFMQPVAEMLPRALSLLLLGNTILFRMVRPLCIYAGLCGCAQKGAAVFGGKEIRSLATVTTIAGDLDNAFSTGRYELGDVLHSDGYSREEVLSAASAVAAVTDNPLFRSICLASPPTGDITVINRAEVPGVGIVARTDRGILGVGTSRLLEELKISTPFEEANDLSLFVIIDKNCVGILQMEPCLRPEASGFQKTLADSGVSRIVLISGRERRETEQCAELIGTQEFYPDCSGVKKTEKIEDLQAMQLDEEALAYIGDGCNDIALMNAADAGIMFCTPQNAFTRKQVSAAMYRDSLLCAADVFKISRDSKKRMQENLWMAVITKLLLALLALIGILPVWVVVFVEFIVLAVELLNAMRVFDPKGFDPGNIRKAAKATGRYIEEAGENAQVRQRS